MQLSLICTYNSTRQSTVLGAGRSLYTYKISHAKKRLHHPQHQQAIQTIFTCTKLIEQEWLRVQVSGSFQKITLLIHWLVSGPRHLMD